MASRLTRPSQEAVRRVRPVVSDNPAEARRRVLQHYKAWQRYLPDVWWAQQLTDYPLGKFRLTLKDQFLKNAHIKDVRVIDRLVAEGQIEIEHFKDSITNPEHVRNSLFRESAQKQPTDFLSKFFHGKE